MTLRLVLLSLALAAPAAPALADPSPPASRAGTLAPADEYFGRARMSVLGIANTIRDAGLRMDGGFPPPSMIDGPLSFVSDALRDWERQYPRDPWISRDLYALELVYLHAATPQAFSLARMTETWLLRDYPDCVQARDAQVAMGDPVDDENGPAYDPWTRFADLRAPLPAPH